MKVTFQKPVAEQISIKKKRRSVNKSDKKSWWDEGQYFSPQFQPPQMQSGSQMRSTGQQDQEPTMVMDPSLSDMKQMNNYEVHAGLKLFTLWDDYLFDAYDAIHEIFRDAAYPLIYKLKALDRWHATISKRLYLLRKYHRVREVWQRPGARFTALIRGLAIKHEMPVQMWRDGMSSFMKDLRLRLPSADYHSLLVSMSDIPPGLLSRHGPEQFEEAFAAMARQWHHAVSDDPYIPGDLRSYDRSPRPFPDLFLRRLSTDDGGGRSMLIARRTTFNFNGTFNGVKMEANADTGAAFNIVSKQLADSMKLPLLPGTEGYVTLPSGRKILSCGSVEGVFQFGSPKGHEVYKLSLIVLDTATHALVLGAKFLRATSAFTRYKKHLKMVISSVRGISLRLLGDDHLQESVPGYLDGSPCLAVPDTGSDIMVVSGAFAAAHGFEVNRGERTWMEFIDGSRERTDGVVRDLEWQFQRDGECIRCDFHVIDGLPVDAILSSTLVGEFEIFSRQQQEDDDVFIQLVPSEAQDPSAIYNIRLVEKTRTEITRLEETFDQDMASSTPFTSEMVERERARRDLIRDRIAGLPEEARQDHVAREIIRKKQFDELWEEHRRQEAAAALVRGVANSASGPTPANSQPKGLARFGISSVWRRNRTKILSSWSKLTS